MAKSRLIVEDIEEEKESKQKATKVTKVPNNYIPISLPSNGKLSAPKVLHFRDYTMSDALELNTLDEDERFLALISVLNNMCYEKFDCGELHINELMVILYTIHATFISNRIEKEYYINDMLPFGNNEGELNYPDNIESVELLINKLKVKSIDEDLNGKELTTPFKEPFTIVDSITKSKIKFRLSRVSDLLLAQQECDKLFEKETLKYKYIKKQLEALKKIKDPNERKQQLDKLIDTNDDYVEYHKYLQKYNESYAMIVQCQQLVSVDNNILETLEDKLNAYKNFVPKDVWVEYNSVVDIYNFGLIEEQEFYSDKLQQNITRRFLFQLSDFLPTINATNSGRFSVSFS
ncbi:MAG: hypothetical protein AB7V16_07400 [Vulcanibacillus sp.]